MRKKIFSIILCTCVILCSAAYASGGSGSSENVALGSTVTVTNTNDVQINTNTGDAASQAVDGSYTTGTSGTGVYNYNICLTLNEIYPINKLNMVFLICKFNGNFEIQTSLDGVNYTTVGNISVNPTFSISTAGTGDYFSSLDFDTVFAKYIKIKDKANHPGMGFRVAEIEVYRDADFSGEIFAPSITYEAVKGGSTETVNHLLAGVIKAKADILYYGSGKQVTLVTALYDKEKKEMVSLQTNTKSLSNGSNVFYNDLEISSELTGLVSYDGAGSSNVALGAQCKMIATGDGRVLGANNGNLAEYATDGDISTKAQATEAYDWTLEAMFDKTYKISSLRIVFADNGFPVQYNILVSEDGQEWKKIKQIDSNDRGGEHIIGFDPVNAKYIRIADQLPQPGVRQMQICELEVYEKKLESDFFEVRSFLIDNINDRNPFVQRAAIIN